jgi:alpha-N-arabinofuranosidase
MRATALSEDRKPLTFAVLNPSDSRQTMKPAVNGVKPASQERLWQTAPSPVDAAAAAGKKPKVAVEEHTLGAVPDTIDVPPFSVNIYSYSLQ